MRENLRDINSLLMKWLFIGTVFLTPLIFSPANFDFFEFPKQVVIWIVAIILLVLWLLRFVLDKEVKIIKTPVELPLLLLIIFSAASLVFSTTRYASLVGFFGRPDGGIASLLAYSVILYVAASTIEKIGDVVSMLFALLLSLGLLSALGLSYYFGIYVLGWAPANVRTFSPAGGIYTLAFAIAMAIPAAIGLLVYYRKATRPANRPQALGTDGLPTQSSEPNEFSLGTIYSALLTLFILLGIIVIATIGDMASVLGVTAGILVLLLWSKRNDLKGAMPYLISVAIAAIFWIAIIKLPQVQQAVPGLHTPLPPAQTLSAADSWYIAGNTVRDFPFLGSGPATFLFDFTRYRSASYNLSDTWNLSFMVASSEYLQILATVGILGFLAYLFFLGRVLWYGFRKSLNQRDSAFYPVKVGLFCGIIVFTVATLFTATTTVTMFLLFIFIALFMATEKISGSKDVTERKLAFVISTPNQTGEARPNNIVPLLLFVPGLLLSLVGLFFIAQYVRANTYYVAGVTTLASPKAGSALAGLQYEEKAVQVNPWEDGYRRDLATTSFNLALAVSQQKNITDADKQTVTALLQQSIQQAQVAASLSPLNTNNWQVLADIYRRIAGQVQGAGDVALQSFQQAIQTDPANAQLFLDVGGIFYAANAYNPAIDAFKEAITLKPNLANAHYNLANAYVKVNDYNDAWVQYQAAQQLVNQLPNNDPTKKQSLSTLSSEMSSIQGKVSTSSAQPAGSSASSSATVAPSPQTNGTTTKGSPSPYATP